MEGAAAPPEPREKPISKMQKQVKHPEGAKTPQQYSRQLWKGEADKFSLANGQALSKIQDYLWYNGGWELASTKKDGACLYSSLMWGVDFPEEYVLELLKRQIIVFLAENAEFFLPILEPSIQGQYGCRRLSKEEYERKKKDGSITVTEEDDYLAPGPFSYATYLKYMLENDTWGDQSMVCVFSMMWQLPITVVYAEDQVEVRIRHDRPLEDVDLVFVFCGHMHYVGSCKYIWYFRRFRAVLSYTVRPLSVFVRALLN